jgi:hypothetical protein
LIFYTVRRSSFEGSRPWRQAQARLWPLPAGLACVDVTELHRSQSSTLENMRLKALGDAPSAFVTTWETELGRPSVYWEQLRPQQRVKRF